MTFLWGVSLFSLGLLAGAFLHAHAQARFYMSTLSSASEKGSRSSVRAPGVGAEFSVKRGTVNQPRGGLPIRGSGQQLYDSKSVYDSKSPQRANVPQSQPAADRREEPQRKRSKLSRIVLNSVQQEVVSALVNLGCSMSQAQEAILNSKQGLSFDELFKIAVSSVNAGKSRRAA